MKLVMWTRYGELGASSRLRFYQFIPFLQEQGMDVKVHNFFDDDYLRRLYSGKKRSLSGVLGSFRRRCQEMRRMEKGVPALIEYELLPHLPYCFEKSFLKERKYILNFDDAVHLHYQKIPFLRNKYPRLIAGAAGIIVANDMLAEEFGKYNENILKLPTVPPASIVPAAQKPDRMTLVWTGTPVTYQYLESRGDALRLAAKNLDFELLVVASESLKPIDGVNCRFIRWSEKNEADALARAHAGLMPLPDTPFARGKSAYKLICYLRAGIPGIASPVGENCRVIRHGENGFFFGSDEEFAAVLTSFFQGDVREKLSSGALESGRRYALPECAAQLADFIRNSCRSSK